MLLSKQDFHKWWLVDQSSLPKFPRTLAYVSITFSVFRILQISHLSEAFFIKTYSWEEVQNKHDQL